MLATASLLVGSLAGVTAAQITLAPAAAAADTVQKYDDVPAKGEVDRFTFGATGWGTATGVNDFYRGSVHYANGVATATYRFVGTNAQVIAGKDVDQGIATFSVDGGPATTVSLYSATRAAQSVVFDTGVLASGTHTVTVTATGTKEAASRGTTVTVDGAQVTGPALQDIDDVALSGTNSWAFDPTWGSAGGISDLYQGTVHYDDNGKTGSATFHFEGSQALIVGVKDVDQGIATYSVDGGPATTVDHYAATRNAQAVLFDTGRLAAGTHTVTVKATGTKNAASTKTILAVDFAAIDGPVQPLTPKTLGVDLGTNTGAFLGGASGSLYGVYGQDLPSNNLLDGINLKTVATKAQDGPQHPGADALEVVKPVVDSSGGDVLIYMTDIYRGFPYEWPATDRPNATPAEKLADYEAKMSTEVDQVKTLPQKYQDHIVFIPYNEPEGNMFGTGAWSYNKISWLTDPQYYFNAWDRAYRLIKAKIPNARIAGPNTSGLFNQVQGFLQHAVANNTLPDLITWHELSSPGSIRTNVAKFRGWENSAYAGTSMAGKHLPIDLDEYAFNYHTSVPAQMIQWFSALEDSKVYGDIAYWNIDGNLDDSAVQNNRGNGQWWLLNAYGQMTGHTVALSPPSPNASYTLQGVGTLDDSKKQANVILGGDTGTVQVKFTNVSSATFGNTAHATITEISWTGQLGDSPQPRALGEFNVPVTGGTAVVNFDGTNLPQLNASSAYQIILTPGANATSTSVDPIRWKNSYEAENASFTGTGYSKNGPEGTPSNVSGFYTSGNYDVGGLRTGANGKLTFSVTVPQDGNYNLAVFANSLNTYGLNATQGPPNVFLTVDGAAERELILPLGYKWVVWDHTDTTVALTAGTHSITLATTSLDGTKSMKGDEIIDKIDLSLPNPNATSSIYEAENATLTGAGTDYTHPGVSGAGVATLTAGQTADFWVYSKNDGETTLMVDTLGGGTGTLTVNGLTVGDVSNSSVSKVFLYGGINKVTMTGKSGTLLLDRIRTQASSGTLIPTVYKAEDATLTGSAGLTAYPLAHNGFAAGNIGGDRGNNNTATFTVNAAAAGTYAVTVRYSNGEQSPASHYNPDPLARHADVSVNGAGAQRVWFPHTFHDDDFFQLSFPVQLKAGANTLKFSSQELPNFDGVTYISDTDPDILLRSKFAPNIDELAITPMGAS